MKELINIAVVVMLLFGGTISSEKIFISTRKAALTKAAHGLPKLTSFAISLTKQKRH